MGATTSSGLGGSGSGYGSRETPDRGGGSMKTFAIVGAIFGVILLLGMFVGCAAITTTNSEARLRNLIAAKQDDNRNEFDLMWKKIAQVAEVSDKDRESLQNLFVAHAEARTGDGGGGEIMKWVQESVPNVPPDTYRDLRTIIVASRDRFAERQKELRDFKREHDNLLTTIPSKWFLSGKLPIEVKIITSTKTEATFKTGVDDDVEVFKKGK